MKSQPPNLAIRLLSRILPPHQREVILGDLEEERLALKEGSLWYWKQTLSIAPRYILENYRGRSRQTARNLDQSKGDGIMAALWNDILYGIRSLRKAPLFTLVSVLTLALAIGATTAIFSVVNALLIQSLPMPNADRIVTLIGKDASDRNQYISYPDFEDLRRQTQRFEGFSAVVTQSVNLTGRAQPDRVRGGFVSDNFFQLMGVKPVLGRSFVPGVDDQENAERVCILQHETWQNMFGSDPALLGKTLQLNNEAFTVIGILPKGFRFPIDEVQVWIPNHHGPYYRGKLKDGTLQKRSEEAVAPFGTLKPGVDLDQGAAEIRSIFQNLSKQYPEAGKRSAVVTTLRDEVVGDVKQMVLVLLGAVLFVLLIACTNVANLMLSRASSRQREFATRAALGAGRRELVRQLFTETSLLWMAGCIAGLIIGKGVLALLLAAAPADLPGGVVARLDVTVFLFAFCITALTAIFFGLIPAIRFANPNLIDAVKEGSRSGSVRRSRLRTALVIGQVALTLILLLGSALMLRSFERLTAVKVGFQPENLLTMEYRLPVNKYPEPEQQSMTHKQILEAIQRLPGVRNAALMEGLPFSGNGGTSKFQIPGLTDPKSDLMTRTNLCTPDYFTTMQIPLLKGRVFTERDRNGASPVAVINQYMAEQYFGSEDPIARKVQIIEGSESLTAEIIGVVGNTKQYALDDPDIAYIYIPEAQMPGIFRTIAVRTVGDPMQMTKAVTAAVWSVDPEQPVWKIRTQQFLIERSVVMPKFLMQLMATYALLALLLAAIGIYGVMSFSVGQRTHEFGLRVALGAQAGDVLRMVLRYGLLMTGIGLMIGVAGSLALGRAVQSLLFQTSPFDPMALAIVAVILLVIAAIASYVPARRATRVDPLTALRYE